MPDKGQVFAERAAADLRHFVRWYDGAFSKAFCDQTIAAFHKSEARHVQRQRGWRKGLEESAWTELDITPLADAAFRGFITGSITEYLARYNQETELPIPVPGTTLLAPLRIKRYRPEEAEGFQLHFDSIGEVANRYLVFLWYLNDVDQGGETAFPTLDLVVQARTGRLLIFPPYWMYQHVGRPPASSDKYILSTYLLFTTSR